MEESKRDGYRVMTQLIDSTIVYTLTNDWGTIRVAYDSNSKLPSYIIYIMMEVYTSYDNNIYL